MDTYGFNGDMPGPTIEINQGDRVRIIVHNRLPEATTLHLHGLELPNDMDGIPYLTQDPIEPGQSFAYELTVHQEGTFFYHTHEGMQEALGMVGLLIIHPAKAYEPVVDRDFVEQQRNELGLIAETVRHLAATGVPVEEAAAAGQWPWEASDPRIANAVRRGYEHLPRSQKRLPLV